VRTFPGHTEYVTSIAFSPDGKFLASGGSDRTVRVHEVESGKLLQSLPGHGQMIYSVAYSPDGKLLASADGQGSVRLWNAAGKFDAQLVKPASITAIYQVAFSPDGKTFATCGQDGTARLFDLGGNEKQKFEGHGQSVTALAFHRDGRTLATGSTDK